MRAWARLLGVAALPAGAAYALLVGQDLNWDLFNYHRYNLHALIVGSFLEDVAPAGLQSFSTPSSTCRTICCTGACHRRWLAPCWAGSRASTSCWSGCSRASSCAVRADWRCRSWRLPWASPGRLPLRNRDQLRRRSDQPAHSAGSAADSPFQCEPIREQAAERRIADRDGVGLKLTNSIYAVGALAAVTAGARPLPRTLRLGQELPWAVCLTGGPWALSFGASTAARRSPV